jgi:CO dehydrogenase maturation factor
MKIAFTGKGGVGKTTLAAMSVFALLEDDEQVLAIDADPAMSFARTLGLGDTVTIKPVSEMKELINERMGIVEDQPGMYRLNPRVSDIPDEVALRRGKLKLIVMGTIKKPGEGCVCPQSAFLRSLLGHILLAENESIVMDMEAGVEHLGRRTAQSVSLPIVVVEPSYSSVEVARKIVDLFKGMGTKRVLVIVNKIRSSAEPDWIRGALGGCEFIGNVPFSEQIREADSRGDYTCLTRDSAYAAVRDIIKGLKVEARNG